MVNMVKRMAMILFIVVSGVILFGCQVKEKEPNIRYESITISSDEISFADTVIPDGDTAKAMADVIVTKTLKDNSLYNEIEIVYDRANGLWKVTYLSNEYTVGGDVTIILSEKTGEVLSIVHGE